MQNEKTTIFTGTFYSAAFSNSWISDDKNLISLCTSGYYIVGMWRNFSMIIISIVKFLQIWLCRPVNNRGKCWQAKTIFKIFFQWKRKTLFPSEMSLWTTQLIMSSSSVKKPNVTIICINLSNVHYCTSWPFHTTYSSR